MVSIQVLATPISGLRRSASLKPMALNMARAGARSRPSVIPWLRCLRSMAKDYNREKDSWIKIRAARFREDRENGEPSLSDAKTAHRSAGSPTCMMLTQEASRFCHDQTQPLSQGRARRLPGKAGGARRKRLPCRLPGPERGYTRTH